MYKKFLEFQKSQSNKNDDDEIPLTKPKKKIKEIIEHVKPIEKEEIKTIPIVKKQKSEKQLEQFKLAQQKRKENIIDKKKQERKLEASRLILEHEKKVNNKPVQEKVIENQQEESSDNETEQEVIIKRKHPKKKKKVIRVVVSDSESDESGESIKATKSPPITRTREMISQRNKKSVIKTHLPPSSNPNNYFCD